MKITRGLFPNMVLCRNSASESEQPVEGSCRHSGKLFCSVKELPQVQNIECGNAEKGHFQAQINGIPCGGPYTITLSFENNVESITVSNVLVGDVWLLGGQSNMQGYGNLENAFPNSAPQVRAYDMTDQWGEAREPLHNLMTALAPVHYKLNGQPKPLRHYREVSRKGVGPGIAFANKMYQLTGIPQGIIASAHGGTTMTQWSPKGKAQHSETLYGAMYDRFVRNGSRVSGLVWYQGCSDANPQDVPLFRQRMLQLIKAVRRDFGNPELPIVQVQISRLSDAFAETVQECWSEIREIQRLLPETVPHLFTVPAIDLDCDDPIHLSGISQNILGRRLAEAMYTLRGGANALPPPIEFKNLKTKLISHRGQRQLILTFNNVVGKLTSGGSRPLGFTMGTKHLPMQFRTDLCGNQVILNISNGLNAFSIDYGYGCNPPCNIVDEAGRALPTFIKLPVIGQDRCFRTGFTEHCQVTAAVEREENLDALSYDEIITHEFFPAMTNGFFTIPIDMETHRGKTGFRFFKSCYDFAEAMVIKLGFGFDGPTKLYCDGKEIYCNKKGINPIIPEQYHLTLELPAGRHEFLFALALNHGAAWGISLLMQRCDVKANKKTIQNPPSMPMECR